MKLLKTLTSYFVTACLLASPQGFAAPLVYSGNNQGLIDQPTNTDPGQTNAMPSNNVMPAAYSTNYENQYAPYSSFMQSPTAQGGANNAFQYAGGGNPDPLNASEVSPYSHYSPYMEVVGEGSNYTLGIDDVVTVIVRSQPDFSGRFVVDPEGNIQYNFVGDIPAVGKTKQELKEEIIKRLKKYVRYPEVAVMVSEYRSKSVYVFGYVNRPGKYSMKGDKITVKEAIVAAGLPRVDGALKRVYVIRPSEYTENGKPQAKKVDLRKLLQKGESAENFLLEPGDTIVVNQRYFDKFVNNFTRLVGPLFQASAVYELTTGFGDNNN